MTMINSELLARAGAPIARFNPVALLSAALIVSLALFVSVDLVTPSVVLVVLLLGLPLTGLRMLSLLRRCWPLPVAAVSVAVINLIFTSRSGGAVLLDLGPIVVTSESLESALGLSLRLVALGLPGIVFFAATEPTRIADALIAQWRVSPRFAIGALAALRLLPLLAGEFRQITLARRTRGVDSGGSPVRALRLFFAGLLTLLVGAIRRATRLAAAMDSRGFDSGVPRTSARESALYRRDWLLMVGGLLVALAAMGISLVAGTWRLLFT